MQVPQQLPSALSMLRLPTLTDVLPAQLGGGLGNNGTSSEKGFFAATDKSTPSTNVVEVGDDQTPASNDPWTPPADTLDVPHLLVTGTDAAQLDGPMETPHQSLTPAAWLPQLPSPAPSTCTAATRDVSQQEPSEGRSENLEQVSSSHGGGRSPGGPCVSGFAAQLSQASQRAPQRLAERFSEQLQQLCLDEAAMGQMSFTWDLKLPSSRRSFLEAVAREFVSRVEALGFEKVEWWTGKEWRKSQGRFHILHDNVYGQYHMRLRVKWTDRLAPEECVTEVAPQESAAEEKTATPMSQYQILEQIQQTLEMQRQMLEVALAYNAQNSSRAASAEVSASQEPAQCHTEPTFAEGIEGTSPVAPLRLNTPVAPVAPFFGPWPTAASNPDILEERTAQ